MESLERRALDGTMIADVMHEFGIRNKVGPIILSMVTEGSEVLFHFLIDTFCLSIRLRMICCAEILFNSQLFSQFSCESGVKLGSSV